MTTTASQTPAGQVQTVLGLVSPEELGPTLMHEHLLVDLSCYYEVPSEASERAYATAPLSMDLLGALTSRWFLSPAQLSLLDEGGAASDAEAFVRCGGGTLVDVTSRGIGRDPLALTRISRAIGAHVVMGAGYYIPQSRPADIGTRSPDSLHDEMVSDVKDGVLGTGVRSGILGELGCTYPLDGTTRAILEAAAAASRATGAAISIHPGPDSRSGDEIIHSLVGAGADPARIAIGHLGFRHRERESLLAIAEAGCYAQFDHFGSFEDTSLRTTTSTDLVVNDNQRLDLAELLLEEGFGEQILVSHDVCWGSHRTAHGGKGYAHIIDNLVPRMRSRGWTEGQISDVLISNPARLLTLEET